MRIIKTALAVLLTLLLTDLILKTQLRQDYIGSVIAVIAALVTIQDTIPNSLREIKERLLSTLLGCTMSILFLWLVLAFGSALGPGYAHRCFFYLMTGVGTILILYICKVMRNPGIAALGVVVFVSVLFAYTEEHPHIAAGVRMLETTIGCAAALAVNALIARPRPAAKN
jgi:uncharacterized membrane protein YgaE (UPF0421/DUF939 family)